MPARDSNSMDPPARKLVEAAGLAGRPIPLEVVAALIDRPAEEALDIGERLTADGLLETTGDSFVSAGGASSLSSVRTAYLYGELARAFATAGYAEREPGTLGSYLLNAGDPEAAIPLIDAAATAAAERGDSADVIDLIEEGITAIEEERVGSAGSEARLRLERAKYYQTAGWSDLAAQDLRVAVRHLQGMERVDALGFLAAVEDNRQESQTAEVYAAAAIGEATAIGEPLKAASSLLLQARILSRIGFPAEADASLAKGVGILQESGNAYQRFLATQNMARIALDRGKARRAEPLFERGFATADDAAGLAAQADAAAWLARAQFMHGHPDLGLASVDVAMELAQATGTSGPIFLGHMAHSEGAARFAAYDEALEAADAMLVYVLERLPDWENAARYLRARALLGLGRVEEAATEIETAYELSPEGINGWRWRLRIEAFRFNVLAARGAEWPKARAEDLTDELLQGQWLDIAAELMAVRAGAEEDPDLARQSAALALQLGIPTTAAEAIEAGGLWSDPAGAAVASRIKDTQRHVPEAWKKDWASQPPIAAGLAAPALVDEELAAATATLQADLDAALLAAGLAEAETALSPAQRRDQGLVRRSGGRARRGALLLGAAAGVVILALGGGALAATLLAAEPTTTLGTQSTTTSLPTLEDTLITDQPEHFTGSWVTLGGSEARTGVTEASGVREAAGHYWRNADNQDQYHASPIVIGLRVVVVARDGQVYFFDQDDGETPGVVDTENGARVTAAGASLSAEGLATNLVIVPTSDGLYAYSVQSLDEIGYNPITTCCTPAADNEEQLIYVGGDDGYLYALKTGDLSEEAWKSPLADGGFGAPISTAITLGGGHAYFGVNNELWRVNLATLEESKCSVPTFGEFLTPVFSDGTVFAANTDGIIYMLDAESCDVKPGINLGEELRGMPAVADDMLFQSHRLGVSAYTFNPDAETPQDTWIQAWQGPKRDLDTTLLLDVPNSPIVTADLVYFGARDSHVYAVDRHTGVIVWEWDAGAPIVNSIAVTDRVVYVATTGGEVIAIAPVAEERHGP